MPVADRRAFLASLLATASAAVGSRPVSGAATAGRASRPGASWRAAARLPRTPAERALLGLPDPTRHLRGWSSIVAQAQAPWTAPGVGPLPDGLPDLRAPGPIRPSAPDAPSLPPPLTLAERYPDLRRRFVLEYYPWYGVDPWYHWNEAGRQPPLDIAATSMPRLGPYDSRDLRVIEQHARWIADAGVGTIDLSWWGRGDFTDLAVPRILDVMAAHDLKVTFHLEPYAETRSRQYMDDIHYLLRQYGDRRGWDALLLLDEGQGRVAPVFKSFRTILPPEAQDCHGNVFLVPDYTPDGEWRRQTDGVRETWRRDFSRVYLLADSLDMGRTGQSGFDGIAVYDNFVAPDRWPSLATDASTVGLLFSFNVNPGYDGYVLREVPPDSCYRPPPFAPGGEHPDWADLDGRRAAQHLALTRIDESFDTTTALQARADLGNASSGFFLAYVNSFNEWHEGHQFEPAKDAAALTPDERRLGYHNPPDGEARLTRLRDRVLTVTRRVARVAPPHVALRTR